eukprot:6212602-Pleurochrysis_carterae.AAC.2
MTPAPHAPHPRATSTEARQRAKACAHALTSCLSYRPLHSQLLPRTKCRRASSTGGTLGCWSCSESPTSSSSAASRAASAAVFSCAASISSISASSSASTVGVPSCLKVFGLARGATASVGSAPSARRHASAASTLPSESRSSAFER